MPLTATSKEFVLPAECTRVPPKDNPDSGQLTTRNYVGKSPFPKGPDAIVPDETPEPGARSSRPGCPLLDRLPFHDSYFCCRVFEPPVCYRPFFSPSFLWWWRGSSADAHGCACDMSHVCVSGWWRTLVLFYEAGKADLQFEPLCVPYNCNTCGLCMFPDV